MLAMTRFDISEDHSAALGIDEGRVHFYLQPCPDSYRDFASFLFMTYLLVFVFMICFAIHQWKLRSLPTAGKHITNTKTNKY
jgi:hypothetical protein